MAISGEDVRWAYRLLLGREPESEDIVEKHRVSAVSRSEFVKRILGGQEFASKNPVPLPIGRYLNADNFGVEVECTKSQLDAMLQRIARAWQKLGETKPYWGVLTQEKFLPKNVGQNIDEFYASGVRWVDIVLATLSRNGVDHTKLRNVVDFGCGVGRLTMGLAAKFESVRGVDVSASYISLARQRAIDVGAKNVQFSTISSFDALRDIAEFDLLVSFIVLQHNPPPVIAHTLDILLSRLKPGGVAIFQIPTFAPEYSFKVEEYLVGAGKEMEMNCLPQKNLFAIASKQRCNVLEVREDNLSRWVSLRLVLQKQR